MDVNNQLLIKSNFFVVNELKDGNQMRSPKRQVSNIMTKELEAKWGIKLSSQETSHEEESEHHISKKENPSSEDIQKVSFVESDDHVEEKSNFKEEVSFEAKPQPKMIQRVKSRFSKCSSQDSSPTMPINIPKLKLNMDSPQARNNHENRNDVFGSSHVDFFQFNSHNKFYPSFNKDFASARDHQTETATDRDERKQVDENFPMMVAFNQNDKIIQPAFMKHTGSMCFTEFWPKKFNLALYHKMRHSAKYVTVKSPGRENETLYRPNKWKKEHITKEKLVESASAWTTKSVALMRALEKPNIAAAFGFSDISTTMPIAKSGTVSPRRLQQDSNLGPEVALGSPSITNHIDINYGEDSKIKTNGTFKDIVEEKSIFQNGSLLLRYQEQVLKDQSKTGSKNFRQSSRSQDRHNIRAKFEPLSVTLEKLKMDSPNIKSARGIPTKTTEKSFLLLNQRISIANFSK